VPPRGSKHTQVRCRKASNHVRTTCAYNLEGFMKRTLGALFPFHPSLPGSEHFGLVEGPLRFREYLSVEIALADDLCHAYLGPCVCHQRHRVCIRQAVRRLVKERTDGSHALVAVYSAGLSLACECFTSAPSMSVKIECRKEFCRIPNKAYRMTCTHHEHACTVQRLTLKIL